MLPNASGFLCPFPRQQHPSSNCNVTMWLIQQDTIRPRISTAADAQACKCNEMCSSRRLKLDCEAPSGAASADNITSSFVVLYVTVVCSSVKNQLNNLTRSQNQPHNFSRPVSLLVEEMHLKTTDKGQPDPRPRQPLLRPATAELCAGLKCKFLETIASSRPTSWTLYSTK